MDQAAHIISRFGGISVLARALGHRHNSTVQGWKERGWVPADQQPLVLIAGQTLKRPLTPADFFEGISMVGANGKRLAPRRSRSPRKSGEPGEVRAAM